MSSHIKQLTAVIFALLLSGCTGVPKHYLEPIQKYKSAKSKTVKIEGFDFGEMQTVGYSANTNFGNASVMDNKGYAANGSYSGLGISSHNQMVGMSMAEDFRGILAQTGCFRVVSPETKSDLTIVGKIDVGEDMSWHYPVAFLEGFTLVALVGAPIPERVSGITQANVYQNNNGELLTSVKIPKTYLSFWSSLYSMKVDKKEALVAIRGMVLRDLAENLAQNFCAE